MTRLFETDLKDICQRAFGKKRKWRERGICNESMRSYSTRTQTTGVLYHGNFGKHLLVRDMGGLRPKKGLLDESMRTSHNNSTRSATSIMSYRYNHSGNVMTVLPLKDVKRHSRAGSCTYQSYL
ncbi:hypothetical protein M8J77_006189 [Diaphorina citri]|nr:hypothetical protein M8J77_006189 [Diaphorina citri]